MSNLNKDELSKMNMNALKSIMKTNNLKLAAGTKMTKANVIELILSNNQETQEMNDTVNKAFSAPVNQAAPLAVVDPAQNEEVTQSSSSADNVVPAPARLIDGTHDVESATYKAIKAVEIHQKDYDGYLLAMLQQKIPARQAELLYKKIGAEMGLILNTTQKKTIARDVFMANDLTTQAGVDAVLAILPEKIDLSKGGVKNWMKAYCEAKKIELAKASVASAGPSQKTVEVFNFIEAKHKEGLDRKAIIASVVSTFSLKESTASIRYSKVAKDKGWNLNPEDVKLMTWAMENARTGDPSKVKTSFPDASAAAKNKTISALKFFQAVMAKEAAAVPQAQEA